MSLAEKAWQQEGTAAMAGQPMRVVQMAVALAVWLAGCAPMTTVEAVQAHPQRNWLTRTVRLRGTVGDRAPLIGGQVYQLQDPTGTIWVLTADPSIQSGDQLLIQGQVRYESIPLAGQEQGEAYIEEQHQLEKNGQSN